MGTEACGPNPCPRAPEAPPPPLSRRAEPERGGPRAGPGCSGRTGSRSATVLVRGPQGSAGSGGLGLHYQLGAEVPRSGGVPDRTVSAARGQSRAEVAPPPLAVPRPRLARVANRAGQRGAWPRLRPVRGPMEPPARWGRDAPLQPLPSLGRPLHVSTRPLGWFVRGVAPV